MEKSKVEMFLDYIEMVDDNGGVDLKMLTYSLVQFIGDDVIDQYMKRFNLKFVDGMVMDNE